MQISLSLQVHCISKENYNLFLIKFILKNTILLCSLFVLLNCDYESNVANKNPRVSYPLTNQTKILAAENDTTIYTIVETMPLMKDCEGAENERQCSDNKLLQYIFKNVRHNPIAKENGLEGKTVVSFVVEKNGAVSGVKVIKGKELSNIEEVIKKMPHWIPGKNRNEIKRVRMTLPMNVCYR